MSEPITRDEAIQSLRESLTKEQRNMLQVVVRESPIAEDSLYTDAGPYLTANANETLEGLARVFD